MNIACFLICFTACLIHMCLAQNFHDDFDYFDNAKWNAINGRQTNNNELETYLPSQVNVGGGLLQLRQTVSGSYLSGKVDTKNKYSFLYGTVEVRAKLPKGRGLWPGIWLVQKDCPSIGTCPTWPPEIDIMENRGDIPNRVTMALHFGRYPNSGYVEGRYDGPDFTSDYHNFKVVWTQSSVTWYIDGVQRFQNTDANKIPREPMYLVINVALGGDYAGSAPSNGLSTTMYVDWVDIKPMQSAINWQAAAQGYWATNCDFYGNDIFTKYNTKAEDATSICQKTSGCTSFTWNDGTLYLKGNAVTRAQATFAPGKVICGYLDNGAQLHPWWCNAAVSFCKGSSDRCCFGFWSNIPASCNACKVACPGRC